MNKTEKFNHLKSLISSGFNFGRFKTLGDFYVACGHSRSELEYAGYTAQQLDRIIGRKELNHLLANLELQINTYESFTLPTPRLFTRQDYLTQKEYLVEIKATTKEMEEYADQLQQESLSNNQALETQRDVSPCELVTDTDSNEAVRIFNETKQLNKTSLYTPQSQHPKQKIKLWRAQDDCARSVYDDLVINNYHSQLIRAGAGSGKTFVGGAVLRRLLDNGWLEKQRAISPFPIFYITRSSIVEQTKRVLSNHFGIDTINEVPVLNIEQFRSRFGNMFISWETKIKNGTDSVNPVWKKNIHPILILGDECHFAKNSYSIQSQIIYSYNDIDILTYHKDDMEVRGIQGQPDHPVFSIWMSATPFVRVCESKYFVVATHMPWKSDYSLGAPKPLNNESFSEFAKAIAHPSAPEDNCTAAIERLMNVVRPYVKEIKGLRPQFKPINKVELIRFRSSKEQAAYDGALEEAEKRKKQVENDTGLSDGQKRMCTLAILTILRRAAEVIRAEEIAERMFKGEQQGFAMVSACCFKATIASIVKILIEKHGVRRSDISIIWGGITTKEATAKKGRKKKLTHAQQSDILAKLLATDDADVESMSDLIGAAKEIAEENARSNIKLYEDFAPVIKAYNLGSQDSIARQNEIDRFQQGKSNYCLFTFKAGGVGLSLHHTDEWTEFKCRKKKDSDWVVEEDIKHVPIRPRKAILTPIYSAIELVQGLGRVPRLTSLSNTEQSMLYYANTIEEAVAANVSVKLKCLKKVVQIKESWEDMIMNRTALLSHGHEKDNDVNATAAADEDDDTNLDNLVTTDEED